jgi:hypothetical protein
MFIFGIPATTKRSSGVKVETQRPGLKDREEITNSKSSFRPRSA